MSEKKLYYKFDPQNGEPFIIDGLMENIVAMIESEKEVIKNEGDEEDVELSITFVWLTDEEFSNLPEAY